MPWAAGVYTRTNGTYTGATVWAQDAAALVKIQSTRHDTHDQDLATGINAAVAKDGSNTVTSLNLTATVNAVTGVITIGGVSFAHAKGTSSAFFGGAGNFTNTGSFNIASGLSALQQITSATYTTAIGNFALPSLTSTANNTALGSNAGSSTNTGANNTYLGAFTGGTVTTGSNTISIGYNCDVPSATANGQMSIGNIIYGFANTGTGATPSTGRIVIGSATDDGVNKLQVAGSVAVSTVGSGLRVKEGANAKQGTVVLVAGLATVANTSVTATSRIFVCGQVDGGATGSLRVATRTPGVSFGIVSSSVADTSTVAYEMFEPA